MSDARTGLLIAMACLACGACDPAPASGAASARGKAERVDCAVGCLFVAAGLDGDGSRQRPIGSIGDAIDRAPDGATILVAAGTYRERITIAGKVLRLLGGFSAGGDYRSRDAATHVTRIAGDGDGATISISEAGRSVVDGFHIEGGRGENGGGISIRGGAPTISDNIIDGNRAGGLGGGIFSEGARATIRTNVIRNNVAQRGGGIGSVGGRLTIDRNQVLRNEGFDDHGGGMELMSSGEITNNLVAENVIGRVGWGWGGGISVAKAGADPVEVTLTGNTVTGNSAPTNGSGVFIDDGARAELAGELYYRNAGTEYGGAGLYVDGLEGAGSVATVDRSTIVYNACAGQNGGNAIYAEQHSRVTVTNSIFWGNTSDVFADGTSRVDVRDSNYSAGQPATGSGNSSSDPLFVDPVGNDFRLQSGSPCEEKGAYSGARTD